MHSHISARTVTELTELIDLAAEALGGTVIAANDEFFAPKEALLKSTPAEWREGAYTERGKWMDGWETRRRRTPGYDWAIVHLGAPGVVRGVIIDTAFFRGNFPESASIEACEVDGTPSAEQMMSAATAWRTILPQSPLVGDAKNAFMLDDAGRVTHLRLNIFPDGGVARFRVHGEVKPAHAADAGAPLDLAAIEHGGFSVVCSDMFFGHRQNLLMPGRSTHMGNGWETKRRRGPGHDWTIIRLGEPGVIDSVELDTDHYKGNAPDSCMLECCYLPAATVDALADPALPWTEMVPVSRLQPHSRHQFTTNLVTAATHVRLNIYPDGGVARLRLLGRRAATIPG